MQLRRQRVKYWDYAIRWYFNGKFHRNRDLPELYYFRDGKLDSLAYHQHDKLHRTTGPAFIDYERKVKEYYYQGKQYSSLDEIKMVEACS